MKKTHDIDISIPFSYKYDAFEVGREIEKKIGVAGDAGAGFGYRDMTFNFKSKLLADKAYSEMQKVFIKYNLEIEWKELWQW